MALQKLTTREPDDSMIEVGIAATEAVFDWKQYLTENFNMKFEEEATTDAESVVETADEAVAESDEESCCLE